ncbi:MAG: peptidoglycan DD-metalloendopeptidase family protein [Flavobacteriales bacterium]|nr:peptidoglycan DD-metalloendopeptidase family protein [Flavobacteriales bacterium]
MKKRIEIKFTLFLILFLLMNSSVFSQTEESENMDSEDSVEFFEHIEMEDFSGSQRLWDSTDMGLMQSYLVDGSSKCIQLVDRDHCGFMTPCKGLITSNFGWRWGRLHAGIDIDLETGDPVVAAFDGIVRKAGWNGGYGYFAIISHFNGLETLYGHLSKLQIQVLQAVKSGQIIGLGGNTGKSRGSHLHFEVRYMGQPMNPKLLINFNEFDLKSYYIDVDHSSTFSRSNYINESPNLLTVMNDSAYRRLEANYEANRIKKQREKEKARKEYLKKKKQQQSRITKEKYKNSKVMYHTVRSGESLYIIAKKYGISVSYICQLNNINPSDIIRPGKKLKVK